ncbi:MAG: hypothetical protein H6600_04505 [Flavobacteriales bacterium]|nr:hypothetical protein [Flavobacteriales bacterium]
MHKEYRNHTIVFYNVENLYDTVDDPGVKDSEFTPFGEKNWTEERLRKKLSDLAETISGISVKHPLIVGLTEVENRNVVQQLLDTEPLRNHSYELIHQDSPDNRGIDACLYYDRDHVKYLSHQFLRVHFPWNRDIKTRDVLFFECEIGGDELWVVVNHWPSRSSNSSEKKREFVAKTVKERIDQITSRNSDCKILVMGDFNDEPNNLSLERYLGAKRSKNIDEQELYNLAAELHSKGKGTCVHEGDWLMIDQMMINRTLLQNTNNGLGIKNNEMHIHDPKELIYRRRNFSQPNHTFSGDRYEGGISDHLPVYVKLE